MSNGFGRSDAGYTIYVADPKDSEGNKAWAVLRQTAKEWAEDKVPRLGAALAYYTVFSLAPLLIIAIAIAGFVFGEEAARGQVTRELATLISPEAAQAIEEMIKNARRPAAGTVATVIGVVTLLFGAAGVVGQMKDAMNTIWGVKPKPGRGIGGLIRDRFLSLAMVMGIGFLLLVSLLLSAGVDAARSYFFGDEVGMVLQVLNFGISLIVVMLLFAVIYKVLPDVKIAWRDVWVGAFATAVLFNVGKFLLGQYLSRSTTASVFGAAGSLIVILIWVYYSTQILFFGAEFTQVFANRFESKLVPAEGMTLVTRGDRAKQGIARESGFPGTPVPARVGRATPLAVVLLIVYDLAVAAIRRWWWLRP